MALLAVQHTLFSSPFDQPPPIFTADPNLRTYTIDENSPKNLQWSSLPHDTQRDIMDHLWVAGRGYYFLHRTIQLPLVSRQWAALLRPLLLARIDICCPSKGEKILEWVNEEIEHKALFPRRGMVRHLRLVRHCGCRFVKEEEDEAAKVKGKKKGAKGKGLILHKQMATLMGMFPRLREVRLESLESGKYSPEPLRAIQESSLFEKIKFVGVSHGIPIDLGPLLESLVPSNQKRHLYFSWGRVQSLSTNISPLEHITTLHLRQMKMPRQFFADLMKLLPNITDLRIELVSGPHSDDIFSVISSLSSKLQSLALNFRLMSFGEQSRANDLLLVLTGLKFPQLAYFEYTPYQLPRDTTQRFTDSVFPVLRSLTFLVDDSFILAEDVRIITDALGSHLRRVHVSKSWLGANAHEERAARAKVIADCAEKGIEVLYRSKNHDMYV
ncbi:hypothetical protein JAAARDRAFT_411638 [Jaapia argillacea MUCL 33604]|uniref:Uncharacterized protein n=1 Tax=Jaapia argillacea MUCL 33604 TaxID=933084 RepID=A0A067PH28_9AGAM|nr:hypothetical protein JAAARDRAFT_411638 [Jaapia argillacea MUCL 33604]